jgi:hypothetical protein
MTSGSGPKTGKESGGTRGERGALRRAERSRAALRENLKRRKEQARKRGQEAGLPHDSAGIAPDKPKD